MKTSKEKMLHAGPERQRKTKVLHTQSSHEKITKKAASRRESMDISVSPVVSLKKRGSIRNRKGSEFFRSMSNSRKSSATSDKRYSSSNVEIVTPFAQILAKLNSVLLFMVNQIESEAITKNNEVSTNMLGEDLQVKLDLAQLKIDAKNQTTTNDALEDSKFGILEDLMWCLEQLKRMDTRRSVSNMAIDQFRKVLNEKQLSSDSDVVQQVFEYLKSYDNDQSHRSSTSSVSSSNGNSNSLSPTFERGIASSSTGIPIQPLYDELDIRAQHGDNRRIPRTQRLGSQGSELRDLVRLGSMDGKTWSISPADLMSEELSCLLRTSNQWGMNVFKLRDLTKDRPLTVLAYKIFTLILG